MRKRSRAERVVPWCPGRGALAVAVWLDVFATHPLARSDSVTGRSDIVTADSDKPRNSVTTISERPVTPSESTVTLFRNQRSRCVGIRTQDALERAQRGSEGYGKGEGRRSV